MERNLKAIDNYKVIDFLGIRLNNLSTEELLDHIDCCVNRKIPCHIVGLNVDQAIKVIENDYSSRIFDNAEIVYTDGMPIIWMSKLLNRPILEKISGPDLMIRLCERAAQKGYKLFFLGAEEGIAQKAAENIMKKFPGIREIDTYSPPFGFENCIDEVEKTIAVLKESNADQVFVGLGSPKQDIFIYENMNKYNIPVSYSMGGALDFLSNNTKRAPKWMRNHGLEWLHRFANNPRKFYRRYFVEDLRIIKYFIKFRNKEKVEGRL